MAVSVPILATVISLHLIAFVLAIGAESRRSKAKIMPDEYDDRTFCVYDTDASTVYGLAAFALLLVSQVVVLVVTRCLCFGKGLVTGCSTTCATLFFIFSWITFLGAEACLLAGSARNAYHTKYRGFFGQNNLSCATLRAEAREATKKESSKKKESGKSSVLLDVKPWDDETDMKKLEEAVRSIQMPGLTWGACKLVPVGYGIKKLQIMMTIVDDLVSVDSLIEEHLTVEPCNEYIQSCDIVAFNKI